MFPVKQLLSAQTLTLTLALMSLVVTDVFSTNVDESNVSYNVSQIKGCSLYPVDPGDATRVHDTLSGGAKMIKLYLTLQDGDREFSGKNETLMYKPFFWVRSTSRQGTGLLLLPPTYDVLSLTTLEFGVETLAVTVGENPVKCLDGKAYKDVEGLLRELVMNDFKNTSEGDVVHMQPMESVCNLHVLNETGTAAFHYHCCHRGDDSKISCRYLKTDIWLNILFVAITFLKILVLLYSPMFIPGSMYRLKNVAMPYVHKLEEGKELKINTVITDNPDEHKNVRQRFKLSDFEGMPNFSTKLQTLQKDVPYRLTLNQISLRVKQERLLPEDYAPVGLLETLYESFFKCKLRERSSVKECCETDFFKSCNCTSKLYPWYALLKDFMKIVMLVVIALPWLLRIYVYFRYEDKEMDMRKAEAETRNLKFYFPGNFTLYLTPLHVVFIAIYALLSIECLTYGALKKHAKEKVKLVLRKCFRDMREVSKIQIFGWLVKVLVKPCTRFGGAGICIGIILWSFGSPVLLAIFSFYMFPTVNITFRLFAHLFVFIYPKDSCRSIDLFSRLSVFLKRMERNLEMETLANVDNFDKTESMKHLGTWYKRLQQVVIIILSLISLYSVIFLVTEFVSFLVEIFVFTLMGFILNAGSLLTYFSLLFLLFVYANDCFGHVSEVFLAFNKTMNNVVLSLGKEKVEEVINQSEEKQRNTVFRVKTTRVSTIENPIELVKNPEGLPRWKVSRLLLFLSKTDQPMIPKHFFFEACKMDYYSVPGELLIAYLRASTDFGIIILFLLFVLVVVLAFGDTYKISATNKLLATVAGGFLPFIFRKCLKSKSVSEVDTSTIQFKNCLDDLVESYCQTWPIYDITDVSRVSDRDVTSGRGVDDGLLPVDSNAIELKEMGDASANDTPAGEPEVHVTENPAEETDKLLQTKEGYENTDDAIIDLLIDISKDTFEFKMVDV